MLNAECRMLKWGTIELNYNPRLRAAAGSVYFDSISLYFVCLISEEISLRLA